MSRTRRSACSRGARATGPRTRSSSTGRRGRASGGRARVRRRRSASPTARRAPRASRPVRARAARRPDPDRRDPPAASRPAHASVRGGAARLPPPSARHLNEEAADALLKDLEEPPPYARILLVADELGPLPETIRSRCQLVPFRRLSERGVRDEIAARAPGALDDEATALARLAGGRLDRVGAAARPGGGRAARPR